LENEGERRKKNEKDRAFGESPIIAFEKRGERSQGLSIPKRERRS
jgi:hypothetical protein